MELMLDASTDLQERPESRSPGGQRVHTRCVMTSGDVG